MTTQSLNLHTPSRPFPLKRVRDIAFPMLPPMPEQSDGPRPDIARLGLNEAPYPPSPLAIAAAQKALTWANRYPDHYCTELAKEISARTGVATDAITFGNGSGELLVQAALIALAVYLLFFKAPAEVMPVPPMPPALNKPKPAQPAATPATNPAATAPTAPNSANPSSAAAAAPPPARPAPCNPVCADRSAPPRGRTAGARARWPGARRSAERSAADSDLEVLVEKTDLKRVHDILGRLKLYGKDIADITTRQNLQLRGIRIEDFTVGNVPARVRQIGDLWKPLLRARGRFDLGRFL
mgnify:CR=1 FL=1